MRFWRAVLLGILLWVLIFFEISILMFGFDLQAPDYYLFHYIILIFLVLLCSYVYFRRVLGGIRQGVLLGLIFTIVGVILDLIITIPLFTGFSGFFNIYILVGYLEGLVLTILFSLIFHGFQQPSLEALKRQVTKIPESLHAYQEVPGFPVRVSKVVMSVKKPRRRTKKKRR